MAEWVRGRGKWCGRVDLCARGRAEIDVVVEECLVQEQTEDGQDVQSGDSSVCRIRQFESAQPAQAFFFVQTQPTTKTHTRPSTLPHPAALPISRRRPGDPPPPAADTADFADFRQRYLSLQQDMETAIGQLRGRLRVAVAARSSGMARLATLDAIMERVLGARERSLLSAIPALLGTRFGRLRDAERQALADAESAAAAAAATANPADDGAVVADATAVAAIVPGAWLDTFRDEMQSILLAELEVRFQTVDGLLAALRTS
ncbi:DUF3348 family protein [Burkholderia sp. Tr-20390]|uniref:DUF3348 family protein n=1 Tax=Burkholderia sp. Tr-20390 TaxID=2703904 RepID=UPI001F11EAF3|nr:DUF3348 family protein [Burkholderia sp. Tr-20390]